jgi:hypothetical protein
LQDLRNGSRVLDSLQINIGSTFLDGVSNQLGRSCFTLGSDDHGLFLLACFINNEGSALGFLLGYLFGFNSCREFGGESKVL